MCVSVFWTMEPTLSLKCVLAENVRSCSKCISDVKVDSRRPKKKSLFNLILSKNYEV